MLGLDQQLFPPTPVVCPLESKGLIFISMPVEEGTSQC